MATFERETQQLPALPGVDLNPRRQPGPQLWRIGGGFDPDAHRDALGDLDPVAGGILRGDHRELGPSGRAQAVDHALPAVVRVGVNADVDALTHLYMGQVSLRKISLDPQVAACHQGHGRGAGAQVLARLGRSAHRAGCGRAHLGVRQVQPGLRHLGHCSLVTRQFLRSHLGPTPQCRSDAPKPLLQRTNLLFGDVGVVARIVETGGRDEAFGHQVSHPLLLAQRKRVLGAGQRDVGQFLAVAGLGFGVLLPHLGQPSFCLAGRHLEWRGVDPEQGLPCLDPLVVLDQNLSDHARNFRTDGHLVRLDVSVFSVHAAPTLEVNHSAHAQGE